MGGAHLLKHQFELKTIKQGHGEEKREREDNVLVCIYVCVCMYVCMCVRYWDTLQYLFLFPFVCNEFLCRYEYNFI